MVKAVRIEQAPVKVVKMAQRVYANGEPIMGPPGPEGPQGPQGPVGPSAVDPDLQDLSILFENNLV